MRRLRLIAALRRLRLARRAVASVEFAVCGVAFILMLMLVLNLGDLALVLSAMTYSTQVTVRQAAVQSGANLANAAQGTVASCVSQTQILGYFNSAMPSLLPQATNGGTGAGAPAIQAVWSQPGSNGIYLQVTASYNWVPFGAHAITLPLKVSETQMIDGTSGSVTMQCS